MSDSKDTRALRLLAVGALVGIGLAGWGIARSGSTSDALPAGAIASVNGEPISAEAFDRIAGAVSGERRRALSIEDRRHLLDRLIDEELLLQRGLALGLARHEPTARRSIVSAVIAAVSGAAETEEPREEDLRTFYTEEPERFTRTGRLTVEAAWVTGRDRTDAVARSLADEIARLARAGGDFGRIAEERGDPPSAPLPEGPLPVETLRQYLGPTAARAATNLEAGQVSDPIRGMGGYHVLRLVARQPGEVAPFEQVRDQVRSEYLRSVGERALRSTLDDLRADARIQLDEARLAPQ